MCVCVRVCKLGDIVINQILVVNLHFCVFVIYFRGALEVCQPTQRKKERVFDLCISFESHWIFAFSLFCQSTGNYFAKIGVRKIELNSEIETKEKRYPNISLYKQQNSLKLNFAYIRQYSLKLEARTIMFSAANAV